MIQENSIPKSVIREKIKEIEKEQQEAYGFAYEIRLAWICALEDLLKEGDNEC